MGIIKEFFSGIRWDYVIITSFFFFMAIAMLAQLGIKFRPWDQKKDK